MPDGLMYEFELDGTNIETTLLVPPATWDYVDGATEQYVMGNGHSYVDGYAQASWNFPYMRMAGWATLMAMFSTDQSVAVSVKTKDATGTYVTKTGIMHKPRLGDTARRGHYGYYDVILKFTQLV